MNHGDGGVGTMVDEEMVVETVVCEEEMKHQNHQSKYEDINEDMNHGDGGGTMVDEEMVVETVVSEEEMKH
jgi:D-ribose pyranose/furanose isomerase RbsD